MEGVSKLFRTSGKRSKPKLSSAFPEGLCRQFSLAEMKIATNNFDEKLLVGEGGFGRVYKGFIDDDYNRTVAIKRLKLKPGQGLVFEDLRTEVALLCQLRHPNLVPLIGYCIDEGENILVYEFIVNGNLLGKLCDFHCLSWKQRLRICIGVARALHYLHTGVKHTIIHGDVRPAKILLNEKWEAKLSDFRSSKVVPPGLSVVPVEITEEDLEDSEYLDTLILPSVRYLDPEYRITSGLTDKSDVYSFGVLLFDVLCGSTRHLWHRAMVRWAKIGTIDQKIDPYLMGSTRHLWHLDMVSWAKKVASDQTIDPYLMGKIAPECFNIYMDIATSCVQNEGKDRPTMNDVEVGLEHALELQESADAARKDGEYYYSVDEYTCNDFSDFASPATVEFTSISSLPDLEPFGFR